MKYERIQQGKFIERPNRFIAHVEIEGEIEVVHVKNTGRCQELLIPGSTVYVQKSNNPERKTKWDLISVEKIVTDYKKDININNSSNENECINTNKSSDMNKTTNINNSTCENIIRTINMDSQITNHVVREWIEAGNLVSSLDFIKNEVTYKKSRFDLYVESGERKIFIEVKGVTLETNGVVKFPDAPSERAVKHVGELIEAVKEGFEAYVFFVIQMKGVEYFTPNKVTHLAFANALLEARKAGVNILAFDSVVKADEIVLANEVPVILGEPILYELRNELVNWYVENKRDLPWRENTGPYEVWVSEIMLQQTRVEAVKGYYKRFLDELPDVKALANAKEDKLLKLWEGLGYYNRVRNMQLAAKQIVTDFSGEFPVEYEQILSLKGIGTYTAGAISSFAFHKPRAAVDGNVLRVICRILGDDTDITKASFKTKIEGYINEIIPPESASDFSQGLIELGATVCIPNGAPKCVICPVSKWCQALKQERIYDLPVKAKQKPRKIEERTVLIFKDGKKLAIQKRPAKGLLAKLYQFPNVLGHMNMDEVIAYSKEIGLTPVKVLELEKSKHIFSHIEWHMRAFEINVDELEKLKEGQMCKENFIFIEPSEIIEKYSIPSAFGAYTKHLG